MLKKDLKQITSHLRAVVLSAFSAAILLGGAVAAHGQSMPLPLVAEGQGGGGRPSSVAIAPARFQLQMKPGTETTVVVNLDHRVAGDGTKPYRVVASLNDWTIRRDGQINFFKAGTQPNSASPWMIYSPAEVAVTPGNIHQIRVTIAVPPDAAPGDHLAALIVEPRPETKRTTDTQLRVTVRFRMAAVFYINVPEATRRGSLQGLRAEAFADSIIVTPTLRNEGNSMIRPVASVRVSDVSGRVVAETEEGDDQMPVLAHSELTPRIIIPQTLPPGAYTVRYRINFQDGGKPVEGVTDLSIK